MEKKQSSQKKTAASSSKKTRGRKSLNAKGQNSNRKNSSKNLSGKSGAKSSRRKNPGQNKASATASHNTRGKNQNSGQKAKQKNRSNTASTSKNTGTKQRRQILPLKWTGAAREVSIKRFLMIAVAVLVLLIYVTARLLYLEVIDKSDLYAAQVDQAIVESPIQAERGNIYDRNMNLLAQSATAQNIKVIPYNVKDAEKLAKTLSSKLSLDYNTVYAKVTTIEDNIVEGTGNVSEDQ